MARGEPRILRDTNTNTITAIRTHPLAITTTVAGSESYVADWVEGLVTSYIGDIKQDVVVQTTIDWNLQKAAEFDVREMVAKSGKSQHFSQGALVAMDPDGDIPMASLRLYNARPMDVFG